jgi:hypothetical protein
MLCLVACAVVSEPEAWAMLAAAAVQMVQNIRGSSAKGDSSSSSASTATGSILPFLYLIDVSSPSS